MKVLHIIPDLEYGSAARQLSWLAPALEQSGVDCHVCVLSGRGPLARSLANVQLHYLDWNRWVDLRPFWRLRRVLATFQPDLIHCWRQESVQALTLTRCRGLSPAIVSSCSWAHASGEVCSKLDQWSLRRMDRLVVQWPAEMEHWKSLAVPCEKLIQISPGVGSISVSDAQQGSHDDLVLPENARVVLCVGPLEASKGIKDAVWAFHILGFLFPDLYLLLVGEGPERKRLDRLAAGLFPERMISLGSLPDYGKVLTRAEVVWVPSLKPRGYNVALEAMAAGKPVVASRLPGLTEIVQDAETGYLIPVGDKVSLARKTRLILDDPNLRLRMGEAGRRRARERFSLDSLVQTYVKLYHSVIPS
jgi:glycosyltransferase involved in cell wall biosynthesis